MHMKLHQLLAEHFQEHSQTEFARKAGVQQSTVSRWKNGDIPPTFENCLRIALALDRDPQEIFAAADKPEFALLYRQMFPEWRIRPVSEEEFYRRLSLDSAHVQAHRRLQDILNTGGVAEIGIVINVDCIWEHVQKHKTRRKRDRETG